MKQSMRVVQHHDRVLLISQGKIVADLPWQAANRLASAITGVARLAEELAKADQVADDAAILLRTGAPFGIVNHRLILDTAITRAVHDRDLRRYLPGSVKSRETFGRPCVTQSEPRS